MLDALEIGYAIKDRRAQLGLTQAQVADAAGVSKRCLWSLELGNNSGVQLNKLTAVLKTLDLDLKIVDGDDYRPAHRPAPEEDGKSAATSLSGGAASALEILTGGVEV